jgi:hypothetical protein
LKPAPSSIPVSLWEALSRRFRQTTCGYTSFWPSPDPESVLFPTPVHFGKGVHLNGPRWARYRAR